MSAQRKYYLFAAAVFGVGAILAIIGGAYGALAIFVVLAMMMLWVQSRVDRFMEDRRPSGSPSAYGDDRRPRERRPSERRADSGRARR